jgi:hypothetical protein
MNLNTQVGKNFDNILQSTYFNIKNKSSFSGVQKLFEEVHSKYPQITKKIVEKWLRKQKSYALHRPIIRKFQRNPIVVSKIDEQWQIDLADISNLSRFNNNIKYLLFCVDVLSKFLWVKPLLDKKSDTIKKAFQTILKESRRKPSFVFTDAGSIFAF